MIPKRFRVQTSGGFTIVEMVVVIAIILFLSALLMPALRRVIETAKMTKCMNNIRQIGQATFLYAADYNGFAPHEPNGGAYWKDGYFVSRSHEETDPSYGKYYPKNKWFPEYLGGPLGQMTPVAYCPKGGRYGDQGAVFKVKAGKFYDSFNNVSYGLNGALVSLKAFYGDPDGGNEDGSDDRYCVPLPQVQHPGEVCLWIEGQRARLGWPGRDGVSGRHYAQSREVSRDKPADSGFTIWEYRGFASCYYVDQHIAMLKMREEVPASDDRFWEHTSTVSRRFK
jgi:type II secretory pathway pseudopilin PulG